MSQRMLVRPNSASSNKMQSAQKTDEPQTQTQTQTQMQTQTTASPMASPEPIRSFTHIQQKTFAPRIASRSSLNYAYGHNRNANYINTNTNTSAGPFHNANSGINSGARPAANANANVNVNVNSVVAGSFVFDVTAKGMVPVDHGTNRELTARLENIYGAEGPQEISPIFPMSPVFPATPSVALGVKQVLALAQIPAKEETPALNYSQTLAFSQGLFAYTNAMSPSARVTKQNVLAAAKNSKCSGMDLLLANRITLAQIFFHVDGMQRFDDLIEIGLRKDHLFVIDAPVYTNVNQRLVDVYVFAQMYHADRFLLQDKLSMVLGDYFAPECPFRIREMAALGWTMDAMMNLGLRKDQFEILATEDGEGVSGEPKKLAGLLGARKEHLWALIPSGSRVENFEKWGWNMRDTISAFMFDTIDVMKLKEEKRLLDDRKRKTQRKEGK